MGNLYSIISRVFWGFFQKFRFTLISRKPDDPVLPVQKPPRNDDDDDSRSLVQPLLPPEQKWVKSYDSGNQKDSVVISILDGLPVPTRNFVGSTVVTDKSMSFVKSAIVHKNSPAEVRKEIIVKSKDHKKKAAEGHSKEIIKSKVVVKVDEGIKWIKHYSSRHRILLVGEGDFSFSASLATAFGSSSNIIATSLDSEEFLKETYKRAPTNLKVLKSRGNKVMHGIDATKIADHAFLRLLKFDRVVYNFPFAGFFKELSREKQLKRHRRLVSLFLKNAKEMISEDGEIHISHKSNGFHKEWNLVSIASSHRLVLIEEVEFNLRDYPGYNTKCGFGTDNNFNSSPAVTYKFGLKRLSYMN